MKKERLFQVIGMIEDEWIKEAEEEVIIQKKRLPIAAVWKWTAAVAGILVIIGTGVLYQHLNQKDHSNSMVSLNGSYIATTEAEMVKSGEGEGLETNGSREEAVEEDGQDLNVDWSEVFLYAEVIEEIYQPYQGEVLYLNLENGLNLGENQKETLLEVLGSEYGIIAITGNFEELCGQGLIDDKAERISGIYLSFEVTEAKENYFVFQIYCWGGRNVIFGWQDCYALYKENGWEYELGELIE